MNDQSIQLERIVAYLDGELSAEESAQVEQQLAADEQFRQQLQGAERAWAALDQLPMAIMGDEFSGTTMELVVDAARQDVEAKTIALPIQRRKRGTTTAVLAAMAVLLGALVFRVGWQNPNRRLIADLPVIQYVDIYSQFRDVDFLQALHSSLGEDTQLDPAEGEFLETELAEFQLVAAADHREDWLESLPEDEKITLRAKFNRFRDLSIQRQTELRELHQQIESNGNREPLLRTMFRYEKWLSGLPPSRQFELREQSSEKSSADHARHVAPRMKQDASEQIFQLSPQELKKIFAAVRPHFQKASKKKLLRMSPQERKEFPSWTDQRRLRELFLGLGESPEHMEQLNELVVESLPAKIRDEFQQLEPGQKGRLVMSWLRQARAQAIDGRRPGKGQREVSEQTLQDFFVEELEPADQERLLALPRDEMQQQLKRLYYGKMPRPHRRRPPEWNGRRPPRGPGRGGPRRRPPPVRSDVATPRPTN